MARVIPFAQKFPAKHPEAGQLTHFVEKFWTSLQLSNSLDFELNMPELEEQIKNFTVRNFTPKGHTIREGHRFKAGDWFSPRIWSGRPYWSPQIAIAPDTQIVNTWDFELRAARAKRGLGGFYLDGIWTGGEGLVEVAFNDGLNINQFEGWFQKPFVGQIICWDKKITY